MKLKSRATESQIEYLSKLFADCGFTAEQRKAFLQEGFGREITSLADLSKGEASNTIPELESRRGVCRPTRYPQGIQGHGAVCPICRHAKYKHARLCRRCNPVFSSYSKSLSWAQEHASGPCVVMYRIATAYEQGIGYAEWTGAEKGAAA